MTTSINVKEPAVAASVTDFKRHQLVTVTFRALAHFRHLIDCFRVTVKRMQNLIGSLL